MAPSVKRGSPHADTGRDRYARMLVIFRTTFVRGVAVKAAMTKAARTARSENGYTLIELIVAAALSAIAFSAVLGGLESSQNTQARDSEWASVVQEGRTGLARMVREMRQAYSIQEDSHSKIVFYATIGGKSWGISYNCKTAQPSTEYDECVRQAAEFKEGKAPSAEELAKASAAPIITEVLNETSADPSDVVFKEYTPNAIAPDLVTVKVVLPSAGTLKLANASAYTHHIVLENGAYIRDMALGA